MVAFIHSTLSGTNLHEDKRIKEPCRVASTGNVSTSAPGSTIDGITMTVGDRVLLKDQSAGSQNGIYIWAAAASPLTRSVDADETSDLWLAFIVGVTEGSTNAGTYWSFTNAPPITINVTSLSFQPLGSRNFTTEMTASDYLATGLTGATALARFVGATSTGTFPGSGTFVTGDFVVDRVNGGFWVCTAGGTPGDWTRVGGSTTNAGPRLFLAANYS